MNSHFMEKYIGEKKVSEFSRLSTFSILLLCIGASKEIEIYRMSY